MSLEPAEMPAQTPAWEADVLVTVEALAKQTALLHQLFIKSE